MRDDFGTFYSLGYQPQAEAKEGNRKIVVKVSGHPDAKVRYTHNLGDQDPVEQLRELTLSALYHGLTDNPLRIELDPKPNPQALGNDRFRVDVMVKVPFEKILLLPQDDQPRGPADPLRGGAGPQEPEPVEHQPGRGAAQDSQRAAAGR